MAERKNVNKKRRAEAITLKISNVLRLDRERQVREGRESEDSILRRNQR